jgi:flavin-dependent dehydrogenase
VVDKQAVTLVGAGLVGSLAAILLARRGHRVDVYEGRLDPRKLSPPPGRSVALVISASDWEAAVLDYQRLQKPNCNAVTELSRRHFAELSEHLSGSRAEPVYPVAQLEHDYRIVTYLCAYAYRA